RLQPQWSAHSMLQISFSLGLSPCGPGLWRGNPAHASHKGHQDMLELQLTSLVT
ncbi:MAG: hypothetical protein EXX96DRAFT_465275, partial [Benjaminiella poitrasii]